MEAAQGGGPGRWLREVADLRAIVGDATPPLSVSSPGGEARGRARGRGARDSRVTRGRAEGARRGAAERSERGGARARRGGRGAR